MNIRLLFGFSVVLLLSGCINNEGIVRSLPPIAEEEYDLSKAFIISIDASNQVFINNTKVDSDGLKSNAKDYLIKNKSESVIYIKPERETSYQKFIDVQNTIVSALKDLRTQLAKEKYNLDLDNLSKEQLDSVRKVYPFNLAN